MTVKELDFDRSERLVLSRVSQYVMCLKLVLIYTNAMRPSEEQAATPLPMCHLSVLDRDTGTGQHK